MKLEQNRARKDDLRSMMSLSLTSIPRKDRPFWKSASGQQPISFIRQIHTKSAENWSCPLQVTEFKTSFTCSTTKRASCRREGAMTCMGVGKRKQGGQRTFFPNMPGNWRAKHFASNIVVQCTGSKRLGATKTPEYLGAGRCYSSVRVTKHL